MTTKEAAKKWSLDVSTVIKYCRKGYIKADLTNTKQGRKWSIPDNTLPPFISRATTQMSIRKNILKAVDTMHSVNAKAFHCDEDVFRSIIEAIVKDGLLCKASSGQIALTDKGLSKLHPIRNANPVNDVMVPLTGAGIKALVDLILGIPSLVTKVAVP